MLGQQGQQAVWPRAVCACALGSIVIFAFTGLARADVVPAGVWARPVDGTVVRPWAPPAHRYGPGHLGVDFEAVPGTPVRAAGPGEVTFAGTVAGAQHVVITHAAGLRTSYSFLSTIAVHRGEVVRAGTVIGASGGNGDNHSAAVFHFGLRSGDEYIDPMLLFGTIDLTEVVHLAPTVEPFGYTVAEERRGILDGFVRVATGVAGGVGDVASAVAGGVASGVSGASGAAAALAVDQLSDLVAAQPAAILGRGLLAFLEERARCDAGAPAADGTGGSGHHAMVVAGIDSKTGTDGATLNLPVDDLGYRDDEVAYYSYEPAGGAYDKRSTYAPLLVSARRLGAQLREQQRLHPGREVDLLAHSQGGVVAVAFLKLFYDSSDPTYPPLGTVVTFSSPLEGAPAADVVQQIQGIDGGAALLAFLREKAGNGFPDLNSAAVRDLATDSEFMGLLDAATLPDGVDLTTIGSTYDTTVPGDHASTSEARRATVVDTGYLGAHTGILRDEDALRTARAALENEDLPCRSFGEFVEAALVPDAISSFEQLGSGR